jgi:hypothetical protein
MLPLQYKRLQTETKRLRQTRIGEKSKIKQLLQRMVCIVKVIRCSTVPITSALTSCAVC